MKRERVLELWKLAAIGRDPTKSVAENFADLIEDELFRFEPVAWVGVNCRTSERELFNFKPSPSVIRDFNAQPLYLRPKT